MVKGPHPTLSPGERRTAETPVRARPLSRRARVATGVRRTVRAGALVPATRGTKGGYTLNRPASDIHLNQVIRVLEGEPAESHCKSYAGVLDACVHTGDCGIRPVIVELHQIVDNALADITLSQLLGTEANVDAALHQIQGIGRKDNRV